MKAFKAIISILLTILFACTILPCAVLGIAREAISKDYIIERVETSSLNENLEISFKNVTKDYVLEDEVVRNLLETFTTKDNINNIVKQFVNNLYEDENFELNQKSISILLEKNIIQIEKQNNIEITEEQKAKIDEVISKISIDYENQKKAIFNEEVYNFVPAVKQMVNGAFYGFLVALVVIVMLNISINMDNIYNGIKFLASGVIVSGGFLMFASKSLASISYKESFNISQNDFGGFLNLFKNIIDGVVEKIYACGTLFLTVGVIAVIVAIALQYIDKNNIKKKPQVL